MKHVKLFEDFSYGLNNPYSRLDQDASESFIVLTGNEGDAFYAISHIKNKGDINLLKMRFSGNEDVFDAIPYTGKNYVGSGYDNSGNIKLKEYKTSGEGLKDGYYEFYSDNPGDQNVEPGEGEGILWGVPSVGFTIYADKGYATTITNDKYLKSYGQSTSGEMKSGSAEAAKYLIGYFATGGMGSHPGIATVDELEKLGWTDQGNGRWKHMEEGFDFYGDEANQMPQALLCVFDADTLWTIKPITRQQADVIYNVGRSADYSEENNQDFKKVLNNILPGIIDKRFSDPVMISVLRNVESNTIYWSDVPEEEHGYWEAEDSKPISIDDFTNSGDY